jgi:hypothetical protein
MMATYPIDPVTNEWTMTYQETGQRLAYSLANGNLVWGPSDATASDGFQYYSSREGWTLNGQLYVSGYGGTVYDYSMLNGTIMWTYGNGGEGNNTFAGGNSPWGHYPIHIAALANGIITLWAVNIRLTHQCTEDTQYVPSTPPLDKNSGYCRITVLQD